MNIVLLSGGSGQRLWPLSNASLSKQFLRIFKSPSGVYESMLQRMLRQLRAAQPDHKIVIATNQRQVDVIRNQVGEEIDLVLEPERRNTFPAILLACAYLYFKKNVGPEEPVIVLPVDPYTEQSYFELLDTLGQGVLEKRADLLLMGTKPTYPSAKYGYILPAAGAEGQIFKAVDSFLEKPSEEQAEGLIAKGALWNCGVFAFSLGYIMDILRGHESVESYEELLAGVGKYAALEKTSFDYAVVEKTNSICVVEYDGEWSDMGTWNTLTDKLSDFQKGNVYMDETVINTHAINMLDIPMLVMGAKDMVAVASHDGILIADKEESSYMKRFVEQMEQRPMYEERRWGDYRVLDYITLEKTQKSLTKRIHLQKGKAISYQSHRRRQEIWVVLEGQGEVVLNGETRIVGPGGVVQIPMNHKHMVCALSELKLIEVQIGDVLEETDIEHHEL